MRVRFLSAAAAIGSLAVLAACHRHDQASSSSGAGASTSSSEFRDWFPVSKASLIPTGDATYFPLRPGTSMTYKGDEGVTLTIRVLDETKMVDGVTTRVIEEREEKNGVPHEVSRNYFAADPATGDVYYFGEGVDMYKNGKVTNHSGSWMSGVDGARFGLMMPGRPVVGDRFQQEIAPGLALDRVEIVSLDERVQTPAGVFEHCVHMCETNPLDKDVGHKWFAPGVGLVKDDEFALVSR